MKKLIAFLLAMPMLAVAQTNTIGLGLGPNVDAIADFLSKGSNWIVSPYGIYDSGSKSGGAGVALAYKLSDYVVPTMRLDYLNRELWMPSGSLQLQLPVTVSKLTVIPFAFTGIATPIAGRANDNGTVVGIFGVGAAIRIGKHWDILGDYETWTGFSGKQYRFGFAYKF